MSRVADKRAPTRFSLETLVRSKFPLKRRPGRR